MQYWRNIKLISFIGWRLICLSFESVLWVKFLKSLRNSRVIFSLYIYIYMNVFHTFHFRIEWRILQVASISSHYLAIDLCYFILSLYALTFRLESSLNELILQMIRLVSLNSSNEKNIDIHPPSHIYLYRWI